MTRGSRDAPSEDAKPGFTSVSMLWGDCGANRKKRHKFKPQWCMGSSRKEHFSFFLFFSFPPLSLPPFLLLSFPSFHLHQRTIFHHFQKERKGGRETTISCLPHTPGQRLTLQTFGSGTTLQTIETQWPGQCGMFLHCFLLLLFFILREA